MNGSIHAMQNKWITSGALLAALAVATGAFGAHALQALVSEKAIKTWETAVQYHIFHAIAIVVCGLLQQYVQPQKLQLAARFFLIGLLLFSGSLYAMVLLQAVGLTSYRWLGAITPLGGFAFITGWVLLALTARSNR